MDGSMMLLGGFLGLVSLFVLLALNMPSSNSRNELSPEEKARRTRLRKIKAKMDKEPARRCPEDKSKMVKKLVHNVLIIDQCKKCGGTWLDKGEVNRVKQFAYESGHDSGYSSGNSSGRSSGFTTGLVLGMVID